MSSILGKRPSVAAPGQAIQRLNRRLFIHAEHGANSNLKAGAALASRLDFLQGTIVREHVTQTVK